MHILVARAAEDAERTAQSLIALGHAPLIAPLRLRVLLDPPWPEGAFDGVLATSRNAFAGSAPPAALRPRPCFCVGEGTAKSAREAGFANAQACGESVRALIADLLPRLEPASTLLYLTGTPRRPELEAALSAAGHRVNVLERYSMARVPALPPKAADALAKGALDAVLHFSAESAAAFFALADQAGLGEAALSPLHLCLSPAVAEALPAPARRRIAAHPRESELLALLAATPPPPKCD